MRSLIALVDRTFAVLSRNLWVPALVARLAMAGEFVPSGYGKLGDLPKLTRYFVELGIPAPGANAAATATTEFVGGLLLLFGFGTRFAAAALSVVMIVAVLTAKIKEAHTLGDFFYLPEPCYLAIFLWLIFFGGGKASVDAFIARKRATAK
jgi:putative oxidoreductase